MPIAAAAASCCSPALLACAEVALSRISRIAVDGDGRRRAVRVRRGCSGLLAEGPRALNLLLLLRLLCEVAAVVIVTLYLEDRIGGARGRARSSSAAMTALNFVLVGVAPRTLGRQHAATRRPCSSPGPVAGAERGASVRCRRCSSCVGNAVTPAAGFREGPFASEAELRDLVERAQRSGVVEQSERDMIESVFELGDTIVREVMVPRTDIVVIERGKTRQAGAQPAAAQRLQPDPGRRREQRRRRSASPTCGTW